MRPDRLIDPSQDLDRSVGESLGTRNQRSIVDEIASASKSGRRKRIEIRDDGVIVGDADIIDFTGSGLVATVLGNVATVDGSAGGGGGTTIAVQEGDVTESLTVSVIDFLDADFDVTISPAGEANVALATGIDAAKIGGGAVSTTGFDYLNGVTSNIQTQLDEKMTHPQVISRLWLVG